MSDPEASAASASPQLNRKCTECEKEDEAGQELQMKPTVSSNPAARDVPPIVHQVLHEPGEPLDAATRSFFEPRFGRDFSSVAIHADAKAAASSRALNANAFTAGQHLVFDEGQYRPNTTAGRRLLAHELTHVVQQSAAMPLPSRAGPQRHRPPGAKVMVQRQPERVPELDRVYKAAVQRGDWQTAAEKLNAFNADDILARLAPLSEAVLLSLEMGAWRNPRVGRKAQVAEIIHDVVSSIDPDAYKTHGPVFPYNFGDRLGPVGGAVVAAAGGLLALRLAAPLLAGYWRQIRITVGMAKVASEADKEDTELLKQEVGTVIERLMKSEGPQRVLVTYQTMTPAQDKVLYTTTQEGAQYAEAVAQGRNLYMLRIPERLYDILIQRNLIQVRQGSMGSQVGDDIRIAPGAMQFLSKYFSEVSTGSPSTP
jgi:hypothetical protein